MANSSLLRIPGPQTGKNRALFDEIIGQRTPWMPINAWSQIVKYSDYSDADTSQSLNLNTTFPRNAFPAHVLKVGALLEHIEGFNSLGNANMILGDTNDDNGLLTSTSVKTVSARWLQTVAAAENGTLAYESAFVPLLQLDTTTTNIVDLSAGIVRVVILYIPLGSEWGDT